MKESTEQLLSMVRSRGHESAQLELKEAVGGVPKSLSETLSVFSNDTGGTILLGVSDPSKGAFPVPDFNPERTMQQAEDFIRHSITPPVSAEVSIDLLATGEKVVRIDVEEGYPSDKPFYVSSKGRYAGSYTRPGEGDRKLSHYEIDRLLENKSQPVHDRSAVESATLEDLDTSLTSRFIENLREREPRAFEGLSDEEALKRANVLVKSPSGFVPSLAGLLALGDYPQSFFPQLDVTVVVLPTPVKGEAAEDGARFLDNQQCSGPLPYIINDAIRILRRSMRSRSVIVSDGVGRENRYEYPLDVIRELLANALLHRDYSEQARGTQVQVELYPDRFVVRSPGGIYGNVDPAEFGENGVSSSRNAVLARILSNVSMPETGYMVAENRGSGIPSVFVSLRKAGMQMPSFRVNLNEVEVTVPHSALMTEEIKLWLGQFDGYSLSQSQGQVLALLRSGRRASNQNLQAWGLHSADATKELSDLVNKGLIVKHNDRRWSTYSLADQFIGEQPLKSAPKVNRETEFRGSARRQRVVERRTEIFSLILNSQGGLTRAEIQEGLSGIGIHASAPTVTNDINALIENGTIAATAAAQSKKRRYEPGQKIALAD